MEDAKFVREQWEEVRTEHIGIWIKTGDRWERFSTVPRGAEFTRQRLEEIRRVEEEIEVTTNAALSATRDVHKVISGECAALCRGLEGAFAVCSVRHGRVILRLQAALSELKQGMKS